MSPTRSSQRNHRVVPLLIFLFVSLAAPAWADSPVSDPAAEAAAEAAAAKLAKVAELESAIRAEQDRLLSLISQKSAADVDGFRETEALRESAKRLPALQRDLAIARRGSGPHGWRSEGE